MKRVAFLGEPWVGSTRRFEAFVMSNPGYRFTFVNFYPIPVVIIGELLGKFQQSGILDRVSMISPDRWRAEDFDLSLPLADQWFEKILPPELPNVVDKTVLGRKTREFGMCSIRELGFDDGDTVFVKPRIGAGQYTTDEISYRKHRYGAVKSFIGPQHFMQEFIDSPLVFFVTFVSNGKTIETVDVTKAFHSVDEQGISLNTHLESWFHEKEKFQVLIDLGLDFIEFLGYSKLPGIYMTQFMRDKRGRIFLNDFNVRTGPASDYATSMGIFQHRVHYTIPFMLSDAKFAEIAVPYVRYRCYLEKNRVPLSPFIENIGPRTLCIEDKQSGLIRNDYESYLEILS